MNRFHFARIARRLAGLPRRRWVAISIGLVVLSLVAIGLERQAGSSRGDGAGAGPNVVQATLADSPSWDRARPGWPKYLPEWPPTGGTASSQAPIAATATQADIHSAAETAATPPSNAAGPELFAPTIQPAPAATTQPQPSAAIAGGTPALSAAGGQFTQPQFLASRSVGPMSIPAQRPAHRFMRSETLEKIAMQSDQQIHHGFELADRGAYFAAQSEFTAALRLIAQGLDDEGNTAVHSEALSAALTAMKEAGDFIPAEGKLEGELDLPPIIASHCTPVLKNVPPEQLQAMRALKQYLTFAEQQLALAAGQEVSASMALGALGKMYALLAGKPNPEIAAPAAKAIVFFQAAILVCPRNYMAANDQGVLLAHSGDYAGARRLLEHSVLVCRCSENLNNLSVVYRQVGEQRLADLAAGKAQVAKTEEIARQKSASLSAGGKVEWVDPAALAQSPGQWADPAPRPAAPVGQQDPASASAASAKPAVGLAPTPYGPAIAR